MNIKKLLVMALVAMGLASAMVGCATVEMTSAGSMKNGDRLLVLQNDGYELLWCIPLWSGAMTWDEKSKSVEYTPVFFKNNADTQHLYVAAKRVADNENCDLVNVTFVDNYLALNLSNCYGAIKVNEVTISAILRPRSK